MLLDLEKILKIRGILEPKTQSEISELVGALQGK